MGADFSQIQRDVHYGKLALTLHGAQEALAEQITTTEIREAILNGSILEDYPEHRRGPCCLIHGKTESGRDLHLVVTKERASQSDNRLRAAAAQVGNAAAERLAMKCDLCKGRYTHRVVVLAFQRAGRSVVVEDVPAMVCEVCGDTLLSEETVQETEDVLQQQPHGAAPLYRLRERATPSG